VMNQHTMGTTTHATMNPVLTPGDRSSSLAASARGLEQIAHRLEGATRFRRMPNLPDHDVAEP
jgi:hypothetical protein